MWHAGSSLGCVGSFSFSMHALSCSMQALVPWPGIKLGPSAWKHGVLTAGPPGKSQNYDLLISNLLLFPLLYIGFFWHEEKKHTHTHTHTLTQLQCSCLENPRDGGACWAAVYGIAQSRTRLKQLSSSSSNRWTKTLGKSLVLNTLEGVTVL